MSIGLALTLSQVGKLYPVSPGWLVTGILTWVVVLVTVIHWAGVRMRREVDRIRAETGTGDKD